MPTEDRTYLLDMLNAAQKIKAFTQGMSREEFNQSELHQNAIVRLLQVIGEAARLISDITKEANPDIAWRKISGMRNHIIHRYFNIDLEIVWQVIETDIDELIAAIEPLIANSKPKE